MKISNQILTAAVFLTLIFYGLMSLVQADDEPVAKVIWGPAEIIFEPVVTSTLALTVSGDTGIYTQTDYSGSETPSFHSFDKLGPLPDGHYKYELSTVPETDREALSEAEKAADENRIQELWDTSQQQRLVQNGYFQVINGQIEPFIAPGEKTEDQTNSFEFNN